MVLPPPCAPDRRSVPRSCDRTRSPNTGYPLVRVAQETAHLGAAGCLQSVGLPVGCQRAFGSTLVGNGLPIRYRLQLRVSAPGGRPTSGERCAVGKAAGSCRLSDIELVACDRHCPAHRRIKAQAWIHPFAEPSRSIRLTRICSTVSTFRGAKVSA